MPDITMCYGIECPLKYSCYRYLAKPNDYQSYFGFTPINIDLKSCEWYWNIKKFGWEDE